MPSQPCGLHRRHSRIESVAPYTNAPAKKGQVHFGSWQLGRCIFPDKTCQNKPVPYWQVVTMVTVKMTGGLYDQTCADRYGRYADSSRA